MFHFAWFPHNIPHGIKACILQMHGFPHSEISGSKVVATSPKRIAGYHVFHRLIVPRHPPYTLLCFNLKDYTEFLTSNSQLPIVRILIVDECFVNLLGYACLILLKQVQCLFIGLYNINSLYYITLLQNKFCKMMNPLNT